jgi:hypothetical protein
LIEHHTASGQKLNLTASRWMNAKGKAENEKAENGNKRFDANCANFREFQALRNAGLQPAYRAHSQTGRDPKLQFQLNTRTQLVRQFQRW